MSHTCYILSKTSTINLFNVFCLFMPFSILLYFLTVSRDHSRAGNRPADSYQPIIDDFRHHSIQSHVLFKINPCSVTGSGFRHQVPNVSALVRVSVSIPYLVNILLTTFKHFTTVFKKPLDIPGFIKRSRLERCLH